MKINRETFIKRWPLFFWIVIVSFVVLIMWFTLFETGRYVWVHAFIHSDFLVHIPLIKSFVYGGNFHPIEYPLFVGEKINYHYGFHIMAAFLERIGLPFSFAVNILSILGFLLLIHFMYRLTKYLTKDRIAPYIAALLPLFNFSLTWFLYIQKHGRDWLIDIPKLKHYTCFGPWDGCIVSVFWNLNIYLNQRHLALGFGLTLLVIWLTFQFYSLKKFYKKLLIITINILILISLVYIHKGMLIVALLFWGVYLGIRFLYMIFFWKKRDLTKKEIYDFLVLAIGLIIGALLVFLFLELAYSQFTRPDGLKVIRIHWGFLYKSARMLHNLNISPFIKWLIYDFFNFGVLPFFALFGFILSLKIPQDDNKKIANISLFFLSWIIFAMANIVVFSIDVAVNHKFFNFTILIWEIYAAYAFVKLFKKNDFWKVVILVVSLLLVFNFIIDTVPIFNNNSVLWEKETKNPISRWIMTHTDPKDKILNITYLVSPINMTGRRIFFGWDYFAMSAGYDTYGRRREYYSFLKIYKKDPVLARKNLCKVMKKYHLKYLYLNGKDKFIDLKIDPDDIAKKLLKGVKPLYHIKNVYIYSYDDICIKK